MKGVSGLAARRGIMLRDVMESRGYSLYKLSKDSGLPYSTLSDLISGKTDIRKCSAEALYLLSKCLGISMESLFLSSNDDKNMYIYTEGDRVVIEYGEERISYRGPKNLIAFKEIRKLSDGGVLHVDTWFSDEDGTIYLEEDFIDLADILSEYGIEALPLRKEDIRLGKPGESAKRKLVDSAMLVSDYMAIFPAENSTEDENVLVVNITRPQNRMTVRLRDYSVLMSSMKPDMEKRGLESVRRNIGMITGFLNERRSHA